MPDYELDSVQQQFTAGELASRRLGDFTTVERLAWLSNYPDPEVGFIPPGRSEASSAFRYIHHNARSGATAANSMDAIRMSQMLRVDAGDNLAQGDGAVLAAANSQGAYVRQASRDVRWLGFARQQLKEREELLDTFPNAEGFFRGELAVRGVGQLVRFIDGRQMVTEQRRVNAHVLKGHTQVLGGVSQAVDGYTTSKQKPEMRDHITEVLRGIGMSELDGLLALAEQNERNRLTFWAARLREMHADRVAKAVAGRALRDAGLGQVA